jgi:hypothetical protein
MPRGNTSDLIGLHGSQDPTRLVHVVFQFYDASRWASPWDSLNSRNLVVLIPYANSPNQRCNHPLSQLPPLCRLHILHRSPPSRMPTLNPPQQIATRCLRSNSTLSLM